VFTTASTWGETSLTWNNKPALSGSGVGKVTSIATSTWAEFDVTSIVSGNGTYDLVLAGTSTDGVDFQSREATNKPQLVVTTQASTDTTPPSAPTNLSASAASATRVDLSWTAATDNVGVTGYEIFRGATSIATIGNVTTYSDTGLQPSSGYTYTVRARDAAGLWSSLSTPASATTFADTTAPSKPTNLSATAVNATRVHLSWSASTDDIGVTNYEISRDGSVLTTVGAVTSYNDDTVVGATSYAYSVKALDAAGNPSAASDVANVTTPDGTPPSAPTGLTATAVSASQIDLSWTAATDNIAVTGYKISRGGSAIATVGAVTTYSDTTAAPNTSYTYRVRALDAASNLSDPSDPASATTPADTEAPSAPTNLTATAGSAGGINLAWTASTDNVAVTNYDIFRGGALLTTVGAVTSYSDASATSGTSYTYKVRALDAAGNPSGFSNDATTASVDTEAPSAPTNLLASAVTSARIDLSWTAATDNVAVTNYAVYRGGALLTTVGNVTTYSDTAVTPGTLYSYQVKALDAKGNASGFSNSSSATTPQQLVTLNSAADARVEEANPSSNFGTVSPLRVDGGTGVHVETYLSFTASGLIGSVRHATLRLYALSGTGDGPTVSPTSTSWTETGINWGNKPAPIGSPVVDLGGIATGTWVDIDVTSLVRGNGTYAFQLSGQSTDGVDFHSKEAPNKPQLVLTMGAQDTQAPTAPTSLTGSAGSPTQVDLNWTVSTDDVAVANYLIYRGTTLVATIGPTATTYSDTSASPNTTYTYTVKARDVAGNLSTPSNAVTITTPTQTVAPVIAAAGDIACANDDPNYNGGAGTSAACRQLYTSNLLVNGGFAAVLPLGDNQYNSGSLTQYQAVYNPTWGRLKSITHPVTGNHEYGTSGASGYFNYFGSAAGDPSKGYYSFDIGSWHLIALNSNCSFVPCTVGSAQETWLKADLAAHANQCTLAFDHHARWSSGHDGDNTFMQPLWQDLYDANADVFLSGHSHDYERFAPQNATGGLDNARGIRQFVVGTGGAFFTGIGSAHANSQVRNNDTFGFLKLTLRPTSYDWQYVPEAGKTFTDSGSTACH
jgi:chitodextrinase